MYAAPSSPPSWPYCCMARRMGDVKRSVSCVAGRWHEGLELLLEQAGELDARAVAILWADDLHAHGEPTGREAGRRRGRRQERHPRVAGPEELVGGGDAAAVHDHGSLVPLALLVVREGRRGRDGAEQDIVVLEELGPRP